MKLINPSVEYWENTHQINHIARCARVCYASESGQDNYALVERLENAGHLSMFRHATNYYIIPLQKKNYFDESIDDIQLFLQEYNKCPYIHYCVDENNLYVSTNVQFIIEHEHYDEMKHLNKYLVDTEEFFKHDANKSIRRFTFCITTQISTSRELNRVSPNNIAEQSTRYCNYSKDKFGNEISVCKPHWYDDANPGAKIIYEHNLQVCENNYISLLKFLKPQDARGVLPLDTATKVVYTYTIEEWIHIINLRYRGTAGTPHPNAKIVIGEVYKQLTEMGYDV